MGIILEEYSKHVKDYKDYMPKSVYTLTSSADVDSLELLEPTEDDKKLYFVEGLDDLSLAIFRMLHTGVGYYIMNYGHKYGVNRKSYGFKSKEDLVHYAMWVVEEFLSSKENRIKHLDELKEFSIGKSDKDMMNDLLMETELEKRLKEVTFNMKTPEDFQERLALIELMKYYNTLAHYILTKFSFFKIMDDIFAALEQIPDVHTLNIAPKPVEQSLFDSCTV